MTMLSIRSATEVYQDAEKCEIVRHWVDHAELAEVSRSLRALSQSLGNETSDDFWRQALDPLRRVAFSLCSTPLPFKQLPTSVRPDWSEMHRLVRQCEQMFPDSHERFSDIAAGLECLLLESTSPLIAPLEELHQQYGTISVALRDSRLNKAVADFFATSKSLRNARIVSASQLRGAHHGQAVVIIGPTGWFPEFICSAPRATAIHIVSYRWIHDSWKPTPLFLHSSNAPTDCSSRHGVGPMPRVRGSAVGHAPSAGGLDSHDLLPPLPVFELGDFSSRGTLSDNAVELVPARLCHLSGGRAVLVAADEGASSLVIDMSQTDRAVVRRVLVDDLEPGLYLLLRTSGGGRFHRTACRPHTRPSGC